MVGIAAGLVGSALVGGALNAFTASRANSARAAEAATNRAFQEELSNTSYQRAMADMRKAGLNPILAYQKGGASTPSGSVAPVEQIPVPDLAGTLSSAVQAKNVLAQTNVAQANAELIEAQVPGALANSAKAALEAQKLSDYGGAWPGTLLHTIERMGRRLLGSLQESRGITPSPASSAKSADTFTSALHRPVTTHGSLPRSKPPTVGQEAARKIKNWWNYMTQ